jgi:branched-chain amino acid transport system ATP-binding protein
MTEDLLVVQDLHVSYGSAGDAVQAIDITVPTHQIVTLIGANGAGKTTTLLTISGLLKPRKGTITFRGEQIDGLSPDQVIRKGIAHVPEGRKVFRNLTVYENLVMGGFCRSDRGAIQHDIERMYDYFPRLKERKGQQAGTLSGGEQQMLAFARALVSGPDLLLLDEPSMGLAPLLVEEVAEIVEDIREQEVTVLLVEQNAELALSIADKGYVLEAGEITLEGKADALLQNDQVLRSYLGVQC